MCVAKVIYKLRQSPNCLRLTLPKRMAVNIKSGLNRLFVVFWVAYALYCLVLYPFQERRAAVRLYAYELGTCIKTHANSLDNQVKCIKDAELRLDTRLDEYRMPKFYMRAWRELLGLVLVPPLLIYALVYAVVRGGVAATRWVWEGFRKPLT